jgi:hypothetical protein
VLRALHAEWNEPWSTCNEAVAVALNYGRAMVSLPNAHSLSAGTPAPVSPHVVKCEVSAWVVWHARNDAAAPPSRCVASVAHTSLSLHAGKGELSARMVRHALNKISNDVVPLTVYQLHSIMSVAPVDTLGTIKYAQMVPVVAHTLRRLTDATQMKQRFHAIEKLATTGMLKSMSTKEGSALEAMLLESFSAADADNSGTLTGAMCACGHSCCSS